ncbi:MAG: MFS transporter [Chloroflexota bacterium]
MLYGATVDAVASFFRLILSLERSFLHSLRQTARSPIFVLIVVTLITSIGAGPLNPIIGAIEFERIPSTMRGRVFGAITAGAWIAMPFGMLLGGILTDRFGIFPMFIAWASHFSSRH